jgi:Opioid growth factor receptor (OGFr) conserved region
MQARLLKSLNIMLEFYGMAPDATNPILIKRHPDPQIQFKQYRNLCESYHNYLRITRIFKSLVELGQEDYVPSILLFILAEQAEHGELNRRALKDSMDRYWVYCMRSKDAQKCVAHAIIWVREENGEFTMETYKRIVMRKQETGVWKFDPVEERLKKREKRTRGLGGNFMGRLRGLA